MSVPTVTVNGRTGGMHAVFIRWSGQSNEAGSRVTPWMKEAGANQIAAVIRGALADAYHAGREDKPVLGVPYAQAGVDDDGYYVECPDPDCGARFYGGPDDLTGPMTEDEITKTAALCYAQHWEQWHR